MHQIQLEDWGWDRDQEVAALPQHREGLVPARIIEEQRDGYRALTTAGILRARAAGRLHHEATEAEQLPTVGDWVLLAAPGTGDPAAGSPAVIQCVLPRRTALVRKEAGTTTTAQVIASNVDIVLLVSSLNAELEPRRIERYLAAIHESGAAPVLVLTKADLCQDPTAFTAELGPVARDAPMHVVSAEHGLGLEGLQPYLRPALTLAVVGSSGVGKSTLINALAGAEEQLVRSIRASDARGRHTTTARRILRLPGGALLVDTPGMREFGLWNAEAGLDGSFGDITALLASCRFSDCGHETEPGCALQAAIEAGTVDPGRVEAWRKLGRELAFHRAKQDGRARREKRLQNRREGKAYRQNQKARAQRRGRG